MEGTALTRRQRMTAAQRRYEQTPKGKACLKRHRDKRIRLNRDHQLGIAATVEQAKAILAYIKERKRAFTGLQSREETEGV